MKIRISRQEKVSWRVILSVGILWPLIILIEIFSVIEEFFLERPMKP